MVENKKVLCTICARGGSKGVKNKNIRLIDGKPLIAHSIRVAKESELFNNIVVSTDSEDIARAAKKYGGEVYFMRPHSLATDVSAKLPVIKHAFTQTEKTLGIKYDYLFDLDTTSPLRSVDDIWGCMELLNEGFCNVITASPARRSPYFNLIELDESKVPFVSKGSIASRRQDSPPCYDMNASIYAWQRDAILNNDSLFSANTRLFVMPEERSLDIDTELDFSIVSALLEKRI